MTDRMHQRSPAIPTIALLLVCLLLVPNWAALADPSEDQTRAQRFASSPFDDPTFFPIGVWLQQPREAARYKAAGINLYVGLWKGPKDWQLQALKKVGMRTVTAQNRLALEHPDRDIIVAWLHKDEPDNAQPRTPRWLTKVLGYGAPTSPRQVFSVYRRMLSNDPTRPVLLGLGQGVAWDGWHGRGRRSGHPEDYPAYLRAGDIVAFNIYPVGHPHPDVAGRLDYVARGIDRLRSWARPGQRIWNAIGASGIHVDRIKPTPAQVRSQVWMSLIHGSGGIVYFVHLFGGPKLVEAALLEDPEMLRAVTLINRRIYTLAPVLNSPSSEGAVRVTTDRPGQLATMVKRQNGAIYVFAVAMVASDFDARIRLNVGPAKRAWVIGESRVIDLDGAVLSDHFAPYAVHLYRIE